MVPPKSLKMEINSNYFEQVYLGKRNDRVSPGSNRRLQMLLPASTVLNNRIERPDLSVFRPQGRKTSAQANLELLLEKW